jgi:2-polyprenyl-3-methyl-5-hydroxy-6-metoxy-1,4-benzoquinol methylase
MPVTHAIDPSPTPALDRLHEAVVDAWPRHAKFLAQSRAQLDADALLNAEASAALVIDAFEADLPRLAAHYRETCEVLAEEELHFRREGTYRAATVAEVDEIMAARPGFWARYFDGLLLSQVLWANHAASCHLLFDQLSTRPVRRVLEVGPGHGLLVARIARRLPDATLDAWDLSEAAVEATRRFARCAGVDDRVTAVVRDAVDAGGDETFDAIVLFEILEHVDDPAAVLRGLSARVAAEGRLHVNIPINSPAPDHIQLYRNAAEVDALAASAGLVVEDRALLPQTGYSLERAEKIGATISYVGVWAADADSPQHGAGHDP